MFHYTWLEIRRMYREPRFVVFTLVIPVAFFLLYANIFGGDGADAPFGLSAALFLMVAMSVFGATTAAINANGSRLALERAGGWLRQLGVTPLSPWAVVGAKTLAAMTLTLPAVLLVYLMAVFTQGVTLAAWQWAAMIAAMWLGALPFAALGVAIGSAAGSDAAQPISMGAMFALNILGGIWIPLQALPPAMRDIASWLPSNRYAELGWSLAGGDAPSAAAYGILAAWTAGLCLLAVIAYRRTTVKS